LNGRRVNFLDIITDKTSFIREGHKNSIIEYDSKFKFYYILDKNPNVLAIKTIRHTFVEKIVLAIKTIRHTFVEKIVLI